MTQILMQGLSRNQNSVRFSYKKSTKTSSLDANDALRVGGIKWQKIS